MAPQSLLPAIVRGEANNVHQVTLDDPDVEEMSARLDVACAGTGAPVGAAVPTPGPHVTAPRRATVADGRDVAVAVAVWRLIARGIRGGGGGGRFVDSFLFRRKERMLPGWGVELDGAFVVFGAARGTFSFTIILGGELHHCSKWGVGFGFGVQGLGSRA